MTAEKKKIFEKKVGKDFLFSPKNTAKILTQA